MSYTRSQFIDIIAPLAQHDMKETGILSSLTIAQACLESSNGNSGLTLRGNNLFGIKGEYRGCSVTMPTTEYYNGVKQTVLAKFRKYPSWKESIKDRSSLFLRLPRYSNLRGCLDYKVACKNVQKDGYATDPQYAKLLIQIIDTYSLSKYDDVTKEDKQLQEAVSKLIKKGFLSSESYNAWKRLDLMQMKYVPALIERFGGIDCVERKFLDAKLTFDRASWESYILTNTFKAENVRALIIKFAESIN